MAHRRAIVSLLKYIINQLGASRIVVPWYAKKNQKPTNSKAKEFEYFGIP